MQPWFLWNLWALLVTLSSKSSHQRPVFFFFFPLRSEKQESESFSPQPGQAGWAGSESRLSLSQNRRNLPCWAGAQQPRQLWEVSVVTHGWGSSLPSGGCDYCTNSRT